MKKRMLSSAMLAVLPVLCLMAVGSANSVMVYGAQGDTTAYYSYFALIDGLAFGRSRAPKASEAKSPKDPRL